MYDQYVPGEVFVGREFKLEAECDGRIAEELFARFGTQIRCQYRETEWEHPIVSLRVTRFGTGEAIVMMGAYEETVFHPEEVANVREIEADGEIPVVIVLDKRPAFLTGYEQPSKYLG